MRVIVGPYLHGVWILVLVQVDQLNCPTLLCSIRPNSTRLGALADADPSIEYKTPYLSSSADSGGDMLCR